MKSLSCFFMGICLLASSMLSTQAKQFPQVESEYVYVMNIDEHQVLYEKAAHEKMYPASMTKMMTVLVALEHIDDMNAIVVFEKDMLDGLDEAGASVVGYRIHDQARVIDLLYGIMLASGADASRAIAYHIAGSEEAFVSLMNKKADQLELENTKFMNTSGLHDDAHYSTAADMARILQEGLKNEAFSQIFTSDSYEIGSNQDQTQTLMPMISLQGTSIYSTKLIMQERAGVSKDIIKGSKTGFTLEGGLCMASIAEHENAQYLLITGQAGTDINSAQHMKDAYTIYQYLFDTYERKLLYQKDETIQAVNILHGSENQVGIKPTEDIYVLVEKDAPNVEIDVIQTRTNAKIEANEWMGKIDIITQGEKRLSYDVYADADVSWSLFAWVTYYLFDCYLFLPVILVLCILFIFFRKRKSQTHSY